MMKLTRHMFGWTADARYMDYYERLLWNVRMGTQDEHGLLMYYVSMTPGLFKTFCTAFDSFWCCTGSGVEEYAKLGDTLYFHDDAGIYVNQFVASEVSWPEKGVRLRQETTQAVLVRCANCEGERGGRAGRTEGERLHGD